MTSTKEKGRPRESGPIPKVVLADTQEYTASLLNQQVFRLTSRCAISVGMAEAIAPMIYRVQS